VSAIGTGDNRGNREFLNRLAAQIDLRRDQQRRAELEACQDFDSTSWPPKRRLRVFIPLFPLLSPVQGNSMHPLFEKASGPTEPIIAAAIEVHRVKGPGLLESIYEWCLINELGLRDLNCVSQKVVVITYKLFP
jgi:hypothetical protein